MVPHILGTDRKGLLAKKIVDVFTEGHLLTHYLEYRSKSNLRHLSCSIVIAPPVSFRPLQTRETYRAKSVRNWVPPKLPARRGIRAASRPLTAGGRQIFIFDTRVAKRSFARLKSHHLCRSSARMAQNWNMASCSILSGVDKYRIQLLGETYCVIGL